MMQSDHFRHHSEIINRDSVWKTKDGRITSPAKMVESHLRNSIDWLQRESVFAYKHDYVTVEGPDHNYVDRCRIRCGNESKKDGYYGSEWMMIMRMELYYRKMHGFT